MMTIKIIRETLTALELAKKKIMELEEQNEYMRQIICNIYDMSRENDYE